MSVEKLIQVAEAEVGYLEKKSNSNLDDKTANAGSNNYTKYARDLYAAGYYNGNKNGYAWCDVFVDWCFYQFYGKELGQKIECQTGDLGAGCYYSAQYYKAQNRLDKTPQVGDQIFFLDSSGSVGHTGLVYKVTDSTVYTIEGNTSGASGVIANGGGVCKKSYSRSYSRICGYGHPRYDLAPKTYTLGWHQAEQGWWYAYSTTAYYKDTWAKIDDKWYCFDADGYALTDKAVAYNGSWYYLTSTGAVQTGGTVELAGVLYNVAADGKLTKAPVNEPEQTEEKEETEMRYEKLSDVKSKTYRETLDKLITRGVIKGREGSGEDLVIDLGEDAIRLLVYLDRAGVFGA